MVKRLAVFFILIFTALGQSFGGINILSNILLLRSCYFGLLKGFKLLGDRIKEELADVVDNTPLHESETGGYRAVTLGRTIETLFGGSESTGPETLLTGHDLIRVEESLTCTLFST